MDPRTFFQALIDKRGLNPTSLARKMKDSEEGAVSQSVMSRFLKGDTDMSFENARRIGKFMEFDPAALLDQDACEREGVRLGLTRLGGMASTVSGSPPFTGFTYSDTKLSLAPVVEWARLGTDLYKGIEEFNQATTERLPFTTKKAVGINCKFVRLESDNHAPRILPGDMILIDPDNKKPAMDELALFSLPNGDHILLRYRETVDGFEGYDERGRVLDKVRHGIQVAGVFVLFLRENA